MRIKKNKYQSRKFHCYHQKSLSTINKHCFSLIDDSEAMSETTSSSSSSFSFSQSAMAENIPPFKRSESTIEKQPILHSSLFQEATQFLKDPLNNRTSSLALQDDSQLEMRKHHHLENASQQQFFHECDMTHERALLNSLSGTKGLKSVKSHAELAKTAHSVRILAKKLNRATIHLNLKSVLVITKARDNSLVYLTKEMTEWLLSKYPNVIVYVDKKLENSLRFDAEGMRRDIANLDLRLRYWTKNLIDDDPHFDFVITLGGDGTVLHASTLFQNAVPPIISFSLGSLGFLTNFPFESFREQLTKAISDGVKTNLRMRFTCRVHRSNGDLVCERQVLNELTVDRGPSPYVTMLELYGDGSLLTIAQADGLIIATPTGSTAYNLSAGGSLVHPGVSAICITPICPHTLSFRPIMVPDSMVLRVKVPTRSRSTAWAAFDGRNRVELEKGDYVSVFASACPFPTVRSAQDEYFESVSRVLNWNSRDEQKSFKHLLSDKNKKRCDEQEDDFDVYDDGVVEEWDIDYSDDEPTIG